MASFTLYPPLRTTWLRAGSSLSCKAENYRFPSVDGSNPGGFLSPCLPSEALTVVPPPQELRVPHLSPLILQRTWASCPLCIREAHPQLLLGQPGNMGLGGDTWMAELSSPVGTAPIHTRFHGERPPSFSSAHPVALRAVKQPSVLYCMF